MNFILNFANPRLITPFDNPETVLAECDALLVPGGPDVDPRRYGEIPEPATGRANIQYEYMDQHILTAFIEDITAVIISTRRSIIICGVNAEMANTVTNSMPPIILPSVKNADSSSNVGLA